MRFLHACALLFALGAEAKTPPHYNLDSLTFLSTDIVVARITRAPATADESGSQFIATVDDTLYGALQPGSKLDQLSELSIFYRPMDDGQRIILFLHRRFGSRNALSSGSAFALIPSGVHLIDAYEHVHEYEVQSVPGPYVADGYLLHKPYLLPSRETDLALPVLSEVQNRIADSLKSTQAIRALLDRATVHDESKLVDLLRTRSQLAVRPCSFKLDAIAQGIANKLGSFGDPAVLLEVYSMVGTLDFDITFLQTPDGKDDKTFAFDRSKYLIHTLSDRTIETSHRVAAADILTFLGGFERRPQDDTDPIANHFFAGLSPQIRSTARGIFDDDADSPHVRALCAQLLRTDQPEVLTDMKQVYARTSSGLLRFAIEESFLDISEKLYFSLNPSGGPVASMVRQAGDSDCVKASPGKLAFIAKFHLSAQSAAQFGQEPRHFVFTDAHTGDRLFFKEGKPLYQSTTTGEDWIELDEASVLPPGFYDLALQIGSEATESARVILYTCA